MNGRYRVHYRAIIDGVTVSYVGSKGKAPLSELNRVVVSPKGELNGPPIILTTASALAEEQFSQFRARAVALTKVDGSAYHEEADTESVPAHVQCELSAYLECGILAHGFARARCPDCTAEFLVEFSRKGRGVCPSCTTKRMVGTAAHLVDSVIPRVRMRQWVLSLPKRLRPARRNQAALATRVLRIFIGNIQRELRRSAAAPAGTRIGALPAWRPERGRRGEHGGGFSVDASVVIAAALRAQVTARAGEAIAAPVAPTTPGMDRVPLPCRGLSPLTLCRFAPAHLLEPVHQQNIGRAECGRPNATAERPGNQRLRGEQVAQVEHQHVRQAGAK